MKATEFNSIFKTVKLVELEEVLEVVNRHETFALEDMGGLNIQKDPSPIYN